MIRSFACPSLMSLQFGYAQTLVEGRAFVRDVLSRMSVEELVRWVFLFGLLLAVFSRRS